MLEGRKINLKLAEKEDFSLLVQWFSDVSLAGSYQHFPEQMTHAEPEKQIVEHKKYQNEWVDFIVEKKNGQEIGWITHYISAPNSAWIEIGFAIIPNERNKGYGAEAIQIMVDYLFLTRDIVRIQAVVDSRNKASRRTLEKIGFKREESCGKHYGMLKENGQTATCTACCEKNGKSPEY